MLIESDVRGFEGYEVIRHSILENEDLNAVNTEKTPYTVVPHDKGKAQVEDGILKALLPKASWNVIRLKKK